MRFLAAIFFCLLALPANANFMDPNSVYTGNANEYASSVEHHAQHHRSAHRSSRDRHAHRWSKKQGGSKTASLGALGTFAGSSLIARARSYVGKTAREIGLPSRLWCSDFMNLITHGGTHSRAALSWAHAGTPDHHGCIGCVAWMYRSGGGHVGLVTGYDSDGNPILISGNYGGRVAETPYPRGRIGGYRNVSSL